MKAILKTAGLLVELNAAYRALDDAKTKEEPNQDEIESAKDALKKADEVFTKSLTGFDKDIKKIGDLEVVAKKLADAGFDTAVLDFIE